MGKEEKGQSRLGLVPDGAQGQVGWPVCAGEQKQCPRSDGDRLTWSFELPQPSLGQADCPHPADKNTEAQVSW